MRISYNKLWKLLIDKGITKTEMRKAAGISTSVLAKMGKNEKTKKPKPLPYIPETVPAV